MSIFDSRRLGLIPDAFISGFASLSIQVIFARLAVGFAGGNEVYLSLMFFLWLLFTAAGALCIRKFEPPALFLTLALITPIAASAFFISPHLAGNLPGQLISPPLYLVTTIIALLPICLINGSLFGSIARRVAGDQRSGETYYNEALGALAGGIISTIYYFSGGRDFSYLIAICLICLIPVGRKTLTKAASVVVIALFVLTSGIGNKLEGFLLTIRYEPLSFQQAVSGRLIRYDATATGDITTIYSGGLKAADFPDEAAGPELFYWPYLIRPHLKNIAFVGAEMTMVDRLIPDTIDRIYIYPEKRWRKLVNADFLPAEQISRFVDPVPFFKKSSRKFDAIVINSGPLISLSASRLETSNFFKSCRDHLTADGILAVSVPAFDGLWPDDLRARLHDIYQKLGELFPAVDYIPGDKLFFIAGASLSLFPDKLITEYDLLDIKSPYVTPALIRSKLNTFKLAQTHRQLEKPALSAGPLVIGHGLIYSLQEAGFKQNIRRLPNPLILILAIALILAVTISFGAWSSGKIINLLTIVYFGAASFLIELLTIYYIQLAGGYLYMVLGIIVGLFMAGLALGAFLFLRFTKLRKLPNLVKKGPNPALALFALLAAIFPLICGHEEALLIIVALTGLAGGYGYAAIAGRFGNNPGLPYGFDLLGAIIGNIAGLALLFGMVTDFSVLGLGCGAGLLLLATNALRRSKLE